MKKNKALAGLLLVFVLFPMFTFADGVGFTAASGVPGQINVDRGYRRTGTSSIQNLFVYVRTGENLNLRIQRIVAAGTGALTVNVYSPTGLQETYTIAQNVAIDTDNTKTYTATSNGIWSVVLTGATNANNWRYDINARTSVNARIPGRVFTERLLMTQTGIVSNTVSLYHLNQLGHQFSSVLTTFQGYDSAIETNIFGNAINGVCAPLYKSIQGGVTLSSCGRNYKQFFVAPATDMPPTATRYNITAGTSFTDWMLPVLTNPTIAITSLSFNDEATAAAPKKGSFLFNISNYAEIATLNVDVNNNGSYMDAVDRAIPFLAGATNDVDFDGLDGLGNAIPCNALLRAQVIINKASEIHFVLNDVEGLGGMTVTRLNGLGAPNSMLFWDDTDLGTAATTTPVLDGTAGVNSNVAGGVHGWPFVNANSWGDNRYIDNWATVPLSEVEATFTFGGNCSLPAIFGTLDAAIDNDRLLVTFNTLSETNNSHFEIEASKDGKVFEVIGTVNSKALNGNATSPIAYEFSTQVNSWLLGGAGMLLLGVLGVSLKRKHTILLKSFMIGGLLFFIAGCSKSETSGIEKDTLFVRIAQVDVNGQKSYSKIVKVIAD